MPSTNNLAQYFAQSQQQGQQSSSNPNRPPSIPRSSKSPSPSSYNVHSKAVDAEDDDHFESSTFALKRTRSVGLLDEFIAPTRKLIEEDQDHDESGSGTASEEEDEEDDDGKKYDIDYDENSLSKTNNNNKNNSNTTTNNDNDDDENQFIEDIDDETYKSKQNQTKKKNSNVYSYDEDYHSYSSYENDENASISPSPPDTPDLYQPHDDNDIVYEPQRHVDYLSHNWKEGDISKSWRYIVLKRKDVANSARLENASWRTWAQAKYHLKTISPEAVNWLKDSDVTWLYGPLYKEPKNAQNLGTTTSTTSSSSNLNDGDKKYGSDSESTSKNKAPLKQKKIKGPKPILKKRTVSEMLSQPSMIKLPPRHHSPLVDSSHPNLPSPPHIDDDFDLISSRVNAQYKQPDEQSQGDENSNKHIPTSQNSSMSKQDSQQSGINDNSSIKSQAQKRHIHFNDRVEQCIALSIPDSEDEEYEGDEEANDIEDSDSDEEGGFFLQVRAPSTPQIHNKDFQLPLSSNEVKNLTHGEHPSRYQTIEILPCTTLKHGSDEEDESDDNNKFALSHNTNTSRGFNYYYDYNSVYSNDISHVQLGNNDYAIDDDTHHLEGVKMVDVPENIVLGSNVEIEDTPTFAEPQHIKDQDELHKQEQKKHEEDDKIQQPQPTRPTNVESGSGSSNSEKKSGGAFDFHSDDDSSEDVDIEEDDDHPTSASSSSIKNFGENLTKVSSSPSYASLSDVAAQGYISQSANTNSNLSNIVSKNYNSNSSNSSPVSNSSDQRDVNELQKDFGNLSPSEERSGFKHTFLKNWKRS